MRIRDDMNNRKLPMLIFVTDALKFLIKEDEGEYRWMMDRFYMFINATQTVVPRPIVICELFVAKPT